MTEYVLAIHREELTKQEVGTHGLYPVDLSKIDTTAFAWLPRHVADAKDPNTGKTSAKAVALGEHLPQILGYFQITDEEGRILTYYRKGKEKGLTGKRSIGVGGHVDIEDSIRYNEDGGAYLLNNIGELICRGANRELCEEIGLVVHLDPSRFTQVISSYVDPTSAVHVGLAVTIEISLEGRQKLVLAEDEFLKPAWLTPEELVRDMIDGTEYETWSNILIQQWLDK